MNQPTIALYGQDFFDNPYPTYQLMRETAPVYFDEQQRNWHITRYKDISFVLKDKRFGRDPERAWKDNPLERMMSNWFVFQNPPDHTRIRQLFQHAFTPKVISGLSDMIDEQAARPFASSSSGERINLIESIAYPFPIAVIAEMLGVPSGDRKKIGDWAYALSKGIELVFMAEDSSEGNAAVESLRAYFDNLIAQRRETPVDDLISLLVQAEDDVRQVSNDELIDNLILIFFAGHETTANMIGNSLLALLNRPDRWEELKAHPELMDAAIDELHRYDCSVQMMARFVLKDVSIGEQHISAGENVIIWLGAANHDPEQFNNPDQLDFARSNNQHLAFGLGQHFCLGSILAKAELKAILNYIIRNHPNICLAEEIHHFRQSYMIRALQSLWVRL